MSTVLASTSPVVDSWLSWFQSRESFDVINKGHLEKLFQSFDHSLDKSNCLEALESHVETVFMHKSSFGSGKVVLFHHLVSVSGTFYDSSSTKEYGFIHGTEKLTSFPMIPDIDVLCKKPAGAAIPVPAMTSFLGASSETEVNALTDSASVTFKPRNFVPVPPFLLESVTRSLFENRDEAKKVLLDCIVTIKEFDTTYASNSDYKEKAKSKCKDILFWLYLVSKDSNAIDATLVMACRSPKLSELLKSFEEKSFSKIEKSVEHSISSHVENSLK